MGFVARLATSFTNLVGGLLPQGRPHYSTTTSTNFFAPDATYETCARVYMTNEIVNAAIRLLATSAAEPCIIGRRWRRERPTYASARLAGPKAMMRRVHLLQNRFVEETPNHPLVYIMNNPNPYTTRAKFMRQLVMDRYIGGNAFVLKARGELRNVLELWRLRPDRVKVITDDRGLPVAYLYTVGDTKTLYPAEDIIHFTEEHPLSDHLGLSPVSVILPRAEADNYMRSMLGQFYAGGGTGPGAILTTSGRLPEPVKEEIRAGLRRLLNNPGAFRETLILEQGSSTYERLGLERGLTDAVPKEVNAVMESRIGLPFGIPGSILGLLIGYESSSYANKRADWQVLWDVTMTPLMADFDDGFTRSLCPEFGGIDELEFNLGDIRALQEDIDDLVERNLKIWTAGLGGWHETRAAVGLDPNSGQDDLFNVPTSGDLLPFEQLGEPERAGVPVAVQEPAEAIAAHYRAQFTRTERRRGRLPRAADPSARAVWEQARPLLAQGKSFEVVSGLLNVNERTLRRYRDTFGA